MPSTGEKGWRVEFAKDEQGKIPSLDYLENNDEYSDPRFEVSQNHLRRFEGLIQVVRVDGPAALSHRQFKKFVGDDSKFAMCEFIIVPEMGHRILCFMRDNKTFVVTCGFRKPPVMETPKVCKERALKILGEYERAKVTSTTKNRRKPC